MENMEEWVDDFDQLYTDKKEFGTPCLLLTSFDALFTQN